MKKTILFLFASLLLFACSSEKKTKVLVQGSSSFPDMNGKVVIIEQYSNGNQMTSDTLPIIENKFSKEFSIDSTNIRMVYFQNTEIKPFELVLEEGTININIDKTGSVKIGGTDLNEKLQKQYEADLEYTKKMIETKEEKDKDEAENKLTEEKIQEYRDRFSTLVENNQDSIVSFIKNNVDNALGRHYIFRYYFSFPEERREQVLSIAPDFIKDRYNYKSK